MLKQYKITLIILTCFIFLGAVLGIGYYIYEKPSLEDENAFVYVDGNLSFNFIEGNKIDTQKEYCEYHFSVTNTSGEAYYYNLSLDEIFGGVGAEFEVTSSREGFQKIEKTYPQKSLKFASTIKINGGETHSYTFALKNPQLEMIRGVIKIELEKDMSNFANIILKNNIVNVDAKTKIGVENATLEEGLIETTDDDGTSYYFRGNVENNYVSFAGFLWRIVKINGDGTVRLVLNELISNNTKFYDVSSELETFENSNVYKTLSEWYRNNLGDYDSFIANSKYCVDLTYDEHGFSTLTRIYTNHNPMYQCLGTTNISKIGLLTADEVSLAGATNSLQNTSFYLYHPEIKSGWWTMSPAKNINGNYTLIEVSKDGMLNDGTNGVLFRGSRPVINLVKKTSVVGSGTLEEPYSVNIA